MGQRAGLSRRLRPHGLRHAGITTALDRTGGDVRAVARFSGHKKLDTLLIYDDNRRDLGGQVAGLVSDD
jgi:integrase/recombinase XerC